MAKLGSSTLSGLAAIFHGLFICVQLHIILPNWSVTAKSCILLARDGHKLLVWLFVPVRFLAEQGFSGFQPRLLW